jgi:hypothetical protein
MGVSEPTFYRWKKQFVGMGVPEIRRQITYRASCGELPDGAMIARPGSLGRAWLVWSGALHPWSHKGYGDPEYIEPGQIVTVLTPQPTISVLAAGYRPTVALSRPPAAISHQEVARYPASVNVAP